jgi:transposase
MNCRRYRKCSYEFKLAAVGRILSGEQVTGLARELDVSRKQLYEWSAQYRLGGAEGLQPQPRGRPRRERVASNAGFGIEASPEPPDDLSAAQRRIGELERKIGQQQLALDFFRKALQQVSGKRQASDGLGAPASTRSSKR